MRTPTHITRLATGIAVIVTTATAIVPAALAGGEPKNESPFTRLAVARELNEGLVGSHGAATLLIRGERKNQLPFTARASRVASTAVIAGEPKNQLPFTRR
jgi:hypothetical protein